MALITLTTDFGTRDGYVAALKGALYAAVPHAQLIDLNHDIDPYDRVAGSLYLYRALPAWSGDVLHLCVVDPGVGSDRPWLAARFSFGWVVVPDNGLLHYLVGHELPSQLRVLSDRSGSGGTFEARDRIAPALCDLQTAEPRLWTAATSYRVLSVPKPIYDVYRSQGIVIHVDRYGSLVTNIELAALPLYEPQTTAVKVKAFVGNRLVGRLRGCYNDVHRGEPLALFNSDGFLEIACREGNAAAYFQAIRGHRVELASEVPLRQVNHGA